MNLVAMRLDVDYGNYDPHEVTNMDMYILGLFLTDDVGCGDQGYPTYQEWAVDDSFEMEIGSNATFLDKEGDFIFLREIFSEEEEPTQLKISRQQFVQLLDEWQEKVCARKPKEVTIKREGDQFILETSD